MLKKQVSKLQTYLMSPEGLKIMSDPDKLNAELENGREVYEILGYSTETLNKFYETACRLSEEKRHEEAYSAFVFLTRIAPNSADFWVSRALVAEERQDWDEALDAYMAAIYADYTTIEYYFRAARFCLEQKNLDQAKQVFLVAKEIASELEDEEAAKELLGHAEALLKDLEQGADDISS